VIRIAADDGQYRVRNPREWEKSECGARTRVPAHGSARIGATVAAASIATARRGASNNFLLDNNSATAA
jgi:hypothetical protein